MNKTEKITLTDTSLSSSKKTISNENDLAEVLKEWLNEKSKSVILKEPKVVELIQKFKDDEDFKKYIDYLVNNYGFDKEKLDKLYEKLVDEKVKKVLQIIQESWYDNEKLNMLLWKDIIEKLDLVKWKIQAVREWTLTIEEQLQKIVNTDTTKKWIRWVKKFLKWMLRMWKDTVKTELKNLINWAQNAVEELYGLDEEVENIVKSAENRSNELSSFAKDYYKDYIALCFLEIAYEKFLEDEKVAKDEFVKAQRNKSNIMINNRLTQIKISKTLLKNFALDNLKFSQEMDLVIESTKYEYKDAINILANILMALTSQQYIKDVAELWNFLQDLKNASIKNYFASTKELNDEITRLLLSPNNTAKIITEEIKILRSNIEKNEEKRKQIQQESKKLTKEMYKAAEELETVIYKSLWTNV